MSSAWNVEVGVKVDPSGVQSALNGIKLKPIEVDIDTSAANKKITALKSELKGLGALNNTGSNTVTAGIVNGNKAASKSFVTLGNSANKALNDININRFEKEFAKLEESINKTSITQGRVSDEVQRSNKEAYDSFNKLKVAQKDFYLSGGNNATRLASAYEDVNTKIKRTKNLLSVDKSKLNIDDQIRKAEAAERTLALNKANLASRIDLWKKNNSAVIGTDFEVQLDNIKSKLQGVDATGLKHLRSEFTQVTAQAQLADKATLNLGDRIKNQIKQYSTYFGVAGVMMAGTQAIRSMYNNTLQVDTQMTELRRVTDLSESQYSNLFTEMTASAKEYGVALSDIISATADWSRAGFDANTSKQLAEITTMYQHVSDLDYDEAAQNLLTSYKGFEKQLTERYNGDAAQAVGHIGDILNELDNKYAVTAAGVGEGLKRSASALDVANNTLEESAAMVAGASEVTQDPK